MKYIIFSIMIIFGTHAFAEEVVGKDAKNIVLTGEILGAHLIGEEYLKMIGAQGGTFFSVKSDGQIYNCYYAFPKEFGYFCESLD
jgi:hypothetical protein